MITALALLLSLPGIARAWDAGGHMLVDEIAVRQLKPEAAKEVKSLVPLLDSRCNEGRPYNSITAGVWLDDMKKMPGYAWSKWHYIDIPCDNHRFVEPAPPHALWAINQAVAVLHSPEADARKRAEALGQLMHLVADVHQPLHTADRNDRGGNGYLIAPLIPSNQSAARKPMNLHAFWDEAYRFGAPEGVVVSLWTAPFDDDRPTSARVPGVISEQATALLAKYPPGKFPELAGSHPINPRSWVVETHALACQNGWPAGPAPAEYEVARLSPEFIQTAHEIAEKQIVLAGCRLAEILNSLFCDNRDKNHYLP